MCFFLQTLSEFTRTYPGLFGTSDDEPGGNEDSGGDINRQFHKRYGWIDNTKKLASFEGIKLEDAWNLPIVQAFNDLSYLKAKDKHDKDFIKDRNGRLQMQL